MHRLRTLASYLPRALVILILAYTLGALTSILCAWRPISMPSPGHRWVHCNDRHGNSWNMDIAYTRRGLTRCRITVYQTSISPPEVPSKLAAKMHPEWLDLLHECSAPGVDSWNITSRGWPRLSLAACWAENQSAAYSMPMAKAPPKSVGWLSQSFTKRLPDGVPIRPMYRGLAYNAALFAAPWLLLLALPIPARTLLRRLRRRCPRCAYDLRASPTGCPECGWRRSPESPPSS